MKSLKAVLTVLALITAASFAHAGETVRSSKSGCTITHNDDGTLTIVCPKAGAK